jgi:hypothetical protein
MSEEQAEYMPELLKRERMERMENMLKMLERVTGGVKHRWVGNGPQWAVVQVGAVLRVDDPDFDKVPVGWCGPSPEVCVVNCLLAWVKKEATS